ncbi:MAG: MotA/TolQ/ExbB proton channel family protein, partial [Candidatus Omnitrophica bacterium]|nr:MotA/TolQ/ExbB proton channel family protein [Candidatus Omnitrophota bacterium]
MPLHLLELAKAVDIVVLVFASVLIVALVPEVLFLRMRSCWRRRKSREALNNALLHLERGQGRKLSSVIKTPHLKDPACRFYESILDPKICRDSSVLLQSLLKEVDGGRLRLANALKSVGPLAGMAGSVLGLMMYSANMSNQEELVGALGFLLSTTLAGTYIAIAAWLVTFLMESEKERIHL